MDWGSLFGRKEKSSTTLSKASTSNKVGQTGGTNTYSEHTQSRSQPRTTSSMAPTFANKPWLSAGERGEISFASEYAHPSQLSPQQRPQEYARPQPHSQAHSQPRSYPQPAQRPVHTAARQPIPTKAKAYFPPQHPNQNQSYSKARSFAHQPAALGAGNNKLPREPLPSMGYVIGSYGTSDQGRPYPVSTGASARGQNQGWSNKAPSLSTPGPSGQGTFQERELNRDGVSPRDSVQKFEEFFLGTNTPGRLGTYHHSS